MTNRTQLNKAEIRALKDSFPQLPEDYFVYLNKIGYGEADSGHMIYAGPTCAEEIYGILFKGSSIVLLGDDMQGYCFGFDLLALRFGEISDFGEWEPWPTEKGFLDYIKNS